MEKLKQIDSYLSGRKSYLVGVLAIGLGIYLNDINLVILGLATMGLRNAIK